MHWHANKGRDGGVTLIRMLACKFFSTEYLVHKLLKLTTFNKILALLKISVLKNYILFMAQLSNQLRLIRIINLKYVNKVIALSGFFRIQIFFLLGSLSLFFLEVFLMIGKSYLCISGSSYVDVLYVRINSGLDPNN